MTQHTEFEMRGYRFRFGPSEMQDPNTTLPRFIPTYSLWRWNGYYWQVELSDCATGDLEEAKYAMQFKLADEREAIRKEEAKRLLNGKEQSR